jgi:hypothetical protein
MFVRVESFGIESKFNKGFENGDMHVVITIESITIVSSIPTFLSWFPCFSTWIPLENSKVLFKVGRFVAIVVIIIGVRGVGDNKGTTKNCHTLIF